MFYQANIKPRPVPEDFPTGLLREDNEIFTLTIRHHDNTLHAVEIDRSNPQHIQDLVNSLVAMINNSNTQFLTLSVEAQSEIVAGPDTSNDKDIVAGEK